MPIFYQQDIDAATRLAVWKIEEEESFFSAHVPLQRDITHPHKRLQHLAGRYLLKYLFPEFPVSLIQIADTRKPFLEDEAFHFSISHCSDYAAVIVSKNKRVGIDIEVPAEKVERILHKFINEKERSLLTSANGLHMPTLIWSVKEAMFKWWGKGNVDFSEMLLVSGSAENSDGALTGNFKKDDLDICFDVRYKQLPSAILAWVSTDV